MSSKLEKLRILNNRLDEQINEENQPLFTDMICYIRNADISSIDQETVRHDLSEMLISAQERGENIEDVIGGDYKEFCDEVIATLRPKSLKEKWIERLDILCLGVSVLGTINILFSNDFLNIVRSLISKKPLNYSIDITLGMIISFIFIMSLSVFIVYMITKNALKAENKSGKLNKIAIGGVIGVVLMAVVTAIWKLGTQILFTINIFVAAMIIIGFYVAHRVLNYML